VSTADSGVAASGLQRRIGFWSCTAIIIGTIIGSGIFRTPASIASEVHSVGGIALLWVAGGLVTLCLGLCLAELATMYPRAGGLYVYLREAFGPGTAFVYGWTFLIVNPAVWAAIALVFGEYVARFVPLGAYGPRVAATALVLFVSVSNYVSLRIAAGVQGVATTAKLLALAMIAILLFAWGDGSRGALAQPFELSLPAPGAAVTALIGVLFSYEGVAGACAAFGEVRDPSRTLPRALIGSVLAVVALYLAVNLAFLYVLPVQSVAASALVAADALQAVSGTTGAQAIAVCVAVSTFGAVAATAIADPRVFYAMAVDRLFFARVGAVHPRFGTPHVAIVISGVLAVAYLWVSTFEKLAAQFILGLWPFFALAVVGQMRLRRTQPGLQRPFRTPGYPVIPLVFIVAAGTLLAASMLELPLISAVNVGISLLGIPVYLLWRRRA
jgi:amino acid transporter